MADSYQLPRQHGPIQLHGDKQARYYQLRRKANGDSFVIADPHDNVIVADFQGGFKTDADFDAWCQVEWNHQTKMTQQ